MRDSNGKKERNITTHNRSISTFTTFSTRESCSSTFDSIARRVLVYQEGVYGWKFDGSVLPYPSYEQGEAPPDPEKFPVEDPDLQRGLEELGRLRVLESAERISVDELQDD